MLKELVLKAVVNVFLDDDEFPVGLSQIESVGWLAVEPCSLLTPSHCQGRPYASRVSGCKYFRLTLI